MRYILFLIFSSFLFTQTCPQDTSGYQVAKDMTICFTKAEYSVQYHSECNCYYYNYKIISPENNKGEISNIYFQFETSKSYSVLDETLPYDPACDLRMKNKEDIASMIRNYIPISIVVCPDEWWHGINPTIQIYPRYKFGMPSRYLKPGHSINFTIASKFPPGKRKIKLEPYDGDIWHQLQDIYGTEDEWSPADADPPFAMADFYSWDLEVVGPVDPEEIELFDGGGQKPDDVNLFLSYGSPKQSQTELPTGTDKFEVFIYYGKTIKPETFKATLNDMDIKNLFSPVPGGGDYVKINLKSGRNVLEFSVDGINKKGQIANDKDRLVLIVK